MTLLNLYCLFHLNLNYSAIEAAQRPLVIKKCYWPLLKLFADHDIPVGIEMTGYTLEEILRIDPSWVAEFKKLVRRGTAELVGSGYSQVIGPLVPAKVIDWNLKLGMATYEKILGIRPKIALVNEMAYSAGLIEHYLLHGYQGIVMDWSNPKSLHPEWPETWRYFPQRAVGPQGETIPAIWSDSIAFQKFQRYTHGDYTLEEYATYLRSHQGKGRRFFPLYTNDAEIFDFRPGRYEAEAKLSKTSEWIRMGELFHFLKEHRGIKFVLPAEALKGLASKNGGHRIHLESPQQPIPVKKQEKYNITRWAITGRDDRGINTACWRISDALKHSTSATERDWKELCYLWSSDFRTHITKKRWDVFHKRLLAFEKRIAPSMKKSHETRLSKNIPSMIHRTFDGRYLTLTSQKLQISLDCRKGLAIRSLCFKYVSKRPLLGTLAHGYFDPINMGADYFSGHLVFEMPGAPKITDLSSVQPEILWDHRDKKLLIRADIPSPLGIIRKCVEISPANAAISLSYELLWKEVPLGSLRLGAVTVNPESFESKTLFYRTHNGGSTMETFRINGKKINHGAPSSFLVSAQHGLGMTNGILEIGDRRQFIRIAIDKAKSSLIGMIVFEEVKPSYFFRAIFSAREFDETSRLNRAISLKNPVPLTCSITLSAHSSD